MTLKLAEQRERLQMVQRYILKNRYIWADVFTYPPPMHKMHYRFFLISEVSLTLCHKALYMLSHNKQDDIAQIRAIMERSTRFLSLSAWASLLAGVYALVGAWLAYKYIYFAPQVLYGHLQNNLFAPQVVPLLLIAGSVFVMAAATGIGLSWHKARKAGERLWTRSARRALANFVIPMMAGVVFIVVLYVRGYYGLIAASTLIFYGLALLNAGNFTFSDVRTLGMLQMFTGLLAAIFPSKGLLFWAMGFGLLHIVYGVLLHWKYERKHPAAK